MEKKQKSYSDLTGVIKNILAPCPENLIKVSIIIIRLAGIIAGLYIIYLLLFLSPPEGSCQDGDPYFGKIVFSIVSLVLIYPYKFTTRILYYLFIILYIGIFMGITYIFIWITQYNLNKYIPYSSLSIPLILFGSNFWAFLKINRTNTKRTFLAR